MTVVAPQTVQDYSDCDTIIDTVFINDSPKFTYKEKYAPHHAGNSVKRLNEKIEDRAVNVNRDLDLRRKKVLPVAYPYR